MKFTALLLFCIYIAYSFTEGQLLKGDLDDIQLNEVVSDVASGALTVIDLYCTLLNQEPEEEKVPQKDRISFIVKYDDKNVTIPLAQPEKIFEVEEFNVEWPTVFLITGWRARSNESTVDENVEIIFTPFRCRGNYNFITFDTSEYIDTLYTWSAVNTDDIGKLIAESLNIFFKSYPIEKALLVGHSLGAQISGSIARNLDQTIPKLFALDAANPCFNNKLKSVSRDDADYVIAIHTNPGGFGLKEPLGHVDFYPNGNTTSEPGCKGIWCPHYRAVKYFAESVYLGNEYSFPAVSCDTWNKNDADQSGEKSYPMGFYTPSNLNGIFCLKTNDHSPYGLNSTGDLQKSCRE